MPHATNKPATRKDLSKFLSIFIILFGSLQPYNDRPAQAFCEACAPKAHMLRKNAALQIICKAWEKPETGGHSKATPGMVLSSIFTPPRMKNAYGTGTSIKKSETLYSPHCLVKECSKIVLDCKYSKKKVYTEFFRHVFRLAMHYYNIFLQFAFLCKCGPLTVLTLKNTSRHPMPADMHTSGSQPQPTIKPGCETACLPMRNGLFRMSEQAVSQCAGCQPVGRCNH